MLFDISHQETKYEQGYNEGYHCTDQQAGKLHSRECKSELQYLQKTRSKHNGNRQKEGKFRCHRSRYTNHNSTQDRSSGAGCSGQCRSHQLAETDDQCISVGQL